VEAMAGGLEGRPMEGELEGRQVSEFMRSVLVLKLS